MNHLPHTANAPVLRFGLLVAAAAVIAALSQCAMPRKVSEADLTRPENAASDPTRAVAAWQVIYGVLQHPRCMNCHPVGDVPLQGDDSHPHAQNVQRGKDGQGLYAMKCSTCHQTQNTSGANLPPGAPHWHLPKPEMPLVFEGKSSAELCRQLKDPKLNGGRTVEQLYHHVAEDALVLWGWAPGDGRTPVPTAHAEFVRAMREWIDNGCGCPEK
jgi:mono/diheme cytochrome c family protein